jgi:ubiquinone/menaquinone biosynthesis C-methylase UbiE
LSAFSFIKYKVGFFIRKITFSSIDYWEQRARKYGERSVLNIGLGDEEVNSIKNFQMETIFPLLEKELNGSEKNLLDFGCGPGRLSVELANLTGCSVIGADPIEYLLQLAPTKLGVSYKKISNNKIPVENDAIDIIWIGFVLGGIVKRKSLNQTINELNRVAKKDCLLFLIENTTDKKNIISWKYLSKQKYIDLFKNFNLLHLKDFYHGGERFSIFAGRNAGE